MAGQVWVGQSRRGAAPQLPAQPGYWAQQGLAPPWLHPPAWPISPGTLALVVCTPLCHRLPSWLLELLPSPFPISPASPYDLYLSHLSVDFLPAFSQQLMVAQLGPVRSGLWVLGMPTADCWGRAAASRSCRVGGFQLLRTCLQQKKREATDWWVFLWYMLRRDTGSIAADTWNLKSSTGKMWESAPVYRRLPETFPLGKQVASCTCWMENGYLHGS